MKYVIILILVALVLCYMFPEVEVVGDSMTPTYFDGEIIRGFRPFSRHLAKEGDVIVYKSPDSKETKFVIKRIEKISSMGVYCLGDNAKVSFDSRYYGYVPMKNIVCKVIQQREKVEYNGD